MFPVCSGGGQGLLNKKGVFLNEGETEDNLFALSAFAAMPDLRLRRIAIKKAVESYHIFKIYLIIFSL